MIDIKQVKVGQTVYYAENSGEVIPLRMEGEHLFMNGTRGIRLASESLGDDWLVVSEGHRFFYTEQEAISMAIANIPILIESIKHSIAWEEARIEKYEADIRKAMERLAELEKQGAAAAAESAAISTPAPGKENML